MYKVYLYGKESTSEFDKVSDALRWAKELNEMFGNGCADIKRFVYEYTVNIYDVEIPSLNPDINPWSYDDTIIFHSSKLLTREEIVEAICDYDIDLQVDMNDSFDDEYFITDFDYTYSLMEVEFNEPITELV